MSDIDPYCSPVLQRLENLGERIPSETVACTSCPIALWYWPAEDALACFCSAFHRETWKAVWNTQRGTPTEAIRFCDGREQAIARLAETSAERA